MKALEQQNLKKDSKLPTKFSYKRGNKKRKEFWGIKLERQKYGEYESGARRFCNKRNGANGVVTQEGLGGEGLGFRVCCYLFI
jgi:hypothetical protein